MGDMKRMLLFMALLFLVLSSSCGSNGSSKSGRFYMTAGEQPMTDQSEWAWVAPIDGGGYCGPAALYHIMHYYGDTGASYYYKEYTLLGRVWADGLLTVAEINRRHPMYVDDTDFAAYIEPLEIGTGWTDLDNVRYLYRSKKESANMYDTYVCSNSTDEVDISARRNRLNYIRSNVLNYGTPVIIHLESSYVASGHYVVLVGYDSGSGTVYYVDSLNNTQGLIAVDVDTFLGDWFYDGGSLYSARWDGTWMAFWPSEYVAPCDRCGG
jgi:hypothetical protein